MEASSITAAELPIRSRLANLAWRAIRPDVPFYALLGLFMAVGALLHLLWGYPREYDLSVGRVPLATRSFVYGMPAFVAALGWMMIRRGHSLRSADTWRDVFVQFFEPGRTLAFVIVLLVLPYFMFAFGAFKASIPEIHPFSLDVLFMQMDRLLHFGEHPWVLLDGFLGYSPITTFIDFTYSLWFAVVWLTLIWQAWHGSYFSNARSQFLLSFAACWIVIGVVFATLFSSAGPVYYGAVTGAPDPFAALVGYLHEVDAARPLKAVWIQGILWDNHVSPGTHPFGEGISAMPSMHVSMAVLMALVGFRVNRFVGWAYTAFAVLILVGSVHLAWHYAIDGYLAAALTIGIWWMAGKVMYAWGRRTRRLDSPLR